MEAKLCEECSLHPAILSCVECDQLFCDLCNTTIHRNGTRKTHIRTSLASQTSQAPLSTTPEHLTVFPSLTPKFPGPLSRNFWKAPNSGSYDNTESVSKISIKNSRVHGKQYSADKDFPPASKRKTAFSENFPDKSLVSLMKKWAYEGKLMHEFKDLRGKAALALHISKASASNLISTGCNLGKLIQQAKRVGNFDLHIVALKVEKMNAKVFLWVLRSLKADEMISTEKAIQSRIKEAFDLKMSPQAWVNFLEYVLKVRITHKKSFSESQGFSLFSEQSQKTLKNFNFQMKSIRDLGTGSENIVIYPSGEEWISYDQYIKSGDVFHLKQSSEWKSFVQFFETLFKFDCPEEKAISGGRYGCAQYLKKSSNSLQHCSLGKLSYMIQLAIDEDLLRYHKTLLVWVPAFDKKCKEDKQALFHTKKLVVEILSICPEGISLAQLPTLLKDKQPYEIDLSKLGFAKLKDLISEIPDIELSSKGKNHPFVRVIKKNNPSTEGVLSVLLEKIEEYDGRMGIIDCEIEVCNLYGYGFKWTTLKFRSIEEFLKASGEFIVFDKVFVEKKQRFFDKHHSYTSSTTSEAYSYYASQEPCFEETKVRLEDLEDQQKRFIEELLED